MQIHYELHPADWADVAALRSNPDEAPLTFMLNGNLNVEANGLWLAPESFAWELGDLCARLMAWRMSEYESLHRAANLDRAVDLEPTDGGWVIFVELDRDGVTLRISSDVDGSRTLTVDANDFDAAAHDFIKRFCTDAARHIDKPFTWSEFGQHIGPYVAIHDDLRHLLAPGDREWFIEQVAERRAQGRNYMGMDADERMLAALLAAPS